jgi:xanthine dehydrogenase accessory factor
LVSLAQSALLPAKPGERQTPAGFQDENSMRDATIFRLFAQPDRPLAVVLGTNEIASAVAVRLVWDGCFVILSHDPHPPVIRRGMAFHDALYDDVAKVDGIEGRRAESLLDIAVLLGQPGCVAVTPLQLTELMAVRALDALIDARMQKYQATPDLRRIARATVGLGPSFVAGVNCDFAVETHPEATGGLLRSGATRAADRIARKLGGVGAERFVYSERNGLWRTPLDIGARIFKGYVIGHLDGLPVRAPIDGFLRGLARDGVEMPFGVKIAELDPRGRSAGWTGTDERGRSIADAVACALQSRIAAHPASPAALAE